MRLQRVLALAGFGSRRKCELLIQSGRVEVDGQVVTELGTRVDREDQDIRVDGETLRRPKKVYYLVNKPAGVLSTHHDPSGRPRVIDLLPPTPERLFTVGRLDLDSEGLILLTNDGDMANQLMHPRYGVEKTYEVLVAGSPSPETMEQLRRGVPLSEGLARPRSVEIVRPHKQSTLLRMVLGEGKNREVRRVLAKVGHKVMSLRRVAIGGLKAFDLPAGAYRKLRPEEVKRLLNPAPAFKLAGRRKVQRSSPT
jgi:23S rRNA pseudouridine2605 synthase